MNLSPNTSAWPAARALQAVRGVPLIPLMVCAYLAASALPLAWEWDVPLVALAFVGLFALLSRNSGTEKSPLELPVFLLLTSTVVSSLASQDPANSLRLSVGLLPALLIFLLVAGHFREERSLGMLFVTLTAGSLGLSTALLSTALAHPGMKPDEWITVTGSPLILVPNDVLLLVLIVPVSLVLLFKKPVGLTAVLAGLSVVMTPVVAVAYQSRGATVMFAVTFVCFVTFLRPRIGFLAAIASLLLAAGVDGLMGFPLLAKVSSPWTWTQRLPLWLVAGAMFADAPVTGHGPHTFASLYPAYLRGLILPDWVISDPRIAPWPHNLYLEMLAERGILGLTTLGFLLFSGLSLAWKVQTKTVGHTRLIIRGVAVSLLAFSTASFFELTLLRQWVVLLLFVLLGTIVHLSKPSKEVG